jgi:hypothetical protein
MIRYSLAHQEHGKIVGKVVAIVREQVVRLGRIYLLQAFKVFQDDFDGQLGPSQVYGFHGCAVVGGACATCLHALAKVVFDALEDNGRVVNGVDLDP